MAEGGLLRVGGDGQEVPGDAAPADAVRPQEQEVAGRLLGAEAEDDDGGGGGELILEVGPIKVARWQNLIPSCPWIVSGWRVWGRNPRRGRDQILQRSVAEP